MGIAAALLAEYNNVVATRNWITNQLLVANNKYTANAEVLSKLQEYDKKYQDYIEDAMDGKELKYHGEILNAKDCCCSRAVAEEIAAAMVPQYDENRLQVCMDTDTFYETLTNTLKAQEEMYKANEQYIKSELDAAAQDGGSTGGGG